MMKAAKKETTGLMDVGGIGSAKASVQVPVKGINYESPASKLMIKNEREKVDAC